MKNYELCGAVIEALNVGSYDSTKVEQACQSWLGDTLQNVTPERTAKVRLGKVPTKEGKAQKFTVRRVTKEILKSESPCVVARFIDFNDRMEELTEAGTIAGVIFQHEIKSWLDRKFVKAVVATPEVKVA